MTGTPEEKPKTVKIRGDFVAPEDMVVTEVNGLPVTPPILIRKGMNVSATLTAEHPPSHLPWPQCQEAVLLLSGYLLRPLQESPGVVAVLEHIEEIT